MTMKRTKVTDENVQKKDSQRMLMRVYIYESGTQIVNKNLRTIQSLTNVNPCLFINQKDFRLSKLIKQEKYRH